jgi:DNA-3-methyladenine glycosylase I
LEPGTVVGEDGIARCPWGASTPEYRAYHDDEWGRPVSAEAPIFEILCLEGFQSGLSWLTVLRKREGFRRAFASFDPDVVAGFGESDIERLLSDSGIIRHRGKISATIANAVATVKLRGEGSTLAAVMWSSKSKPGSPAKTLGDLPASTPESAALSKELRRLGFKFVGPTTVYSAMQSLGIVNDHLTGCHFRDVAEKDRAVFEVPR